MRWRRAHRAKTAADRDLQRHVGQAEAAVRAALDVCGRAVRNLPEDEGNRFRVQAKRFTQAEQLLAAIDHLPSPKDEEDVRREARALCAWLETRERAAGNHRPSRVGSEYQARLRQVMTFLQAVRQISADDPAESVGPTVEVVRVADGED